MKKKTLIKQIVAFSLASVITAVAPVTVWAGSQENIGESVSASSKIYYDDSFYKNHKNACDFLADEILKFNTKIDISSYNIKKSEVSALFRQVQRSHPEFFFISSKFQYSYLDADIYDIIPNYTFTKSEAKAMQEKIDLAVNPIISKCKSIKTDFEKALAVHDYIILNCEYDLSSGDFNTTIYDCLVNKKSGCVGYTQAFAYILKLLGINTEFVMSEQMVHTWNKVEIDGKYYNVDLTWDDPRDDRFGHVSHKYFMWSDGGYQNNGNLSKHYNYTVSNQASSNRFDSNFIHEINAKFCFVNGSCYTIDDNSGSKFEKCLIEVDTINGSVKKNLAKLNDVWYLAGSSTLFWLNGYHSIADFNGNLYYSTTDCVYQYNFATGTSSAIISKIATPSQYYIYGMCIDAKGNVIVSKNNTPSSNVGRTFQTVKTISSLTITRPASKGDVDGDGILSITDVTQIQLYCAKMINFTSAQISLADYNKDEIVDVMDATQIQLKVANLI